MSGTTIAPATVVAVRQVIPSMRRIGGPDRARAAHNGQRAGQGPQLHAI